MYTVNLEFPALIISILCLLYSLLVRRRQYIPPKGFKNKLLNQHFIFITVLLCHIIATTSSVLAVILQNYPDYVSHYVIYILNEVYFIFHNLLSVAFALYILNVYGSFKGRKKLFYFILFAPFLITELIVLINPFTNLVFSFTNDFVYSRGPLIYLLYFCGAFYLFISFYFFFKYKRAINKADSYAIGFVIILACLGILAQAIFANWLLELFAESLAFLATLVLLEERNGHIDPVTGALNKKAFIDTVRRYLENNRNHSIIIIKITNIDILSKSFLTSDIDNLLLDISSFLSTIASDENIYYYKYGSFALVAPDKTDEQNAQKSAQIFERFCQEWKINANKIIVDAAICVVKYPDNINSLGELEELINTNYITKKNGPYIVSNKELHEIQEKLLFERSLKNALENNKLYLNYQPIWSIKENKVVAAEALLRANNELLKNHSPEQYIPIAESSGLIHEIGLFVFEQVCKCYKERNLDRLGLEYLELNLSLYQFYYDDIVEKFEAIRKKYDVDASHINLEITESGAMPINDHIITIIDKFKSIGYNFSLDDFGTGYSNLVKIFQIEFKTIKIDKSILWDSFTNQASYAFLNTMFSIINNIGYNTIQEGVETKQQLDLVVKLGGDLIQGYYFSRPLDENNFIDYLSIHNKKDTN